MKVLGSFVILILLFPLHSFAQESRKDIPCDQFSQGIENKIRQGFEEAKAQAQTAGQCDNSTFGLAAQNTVARCHQLIAEADNYCRSIRYEPPTMSQGGVGDQGLNASKNLTAATDKFDNESIACGDKLANIPKSCKRFSEMYRSQLVSSGCNVEQIEQAASVSIQKALPQIIKFCQTANYYKNAQADHFRMISSQIKTNNGIVAPTQGHNL